jgi:hypothetical protein
MHSQFAGRIAVTTAFLAFKIDDHHVFGMHHPFAHAGGRSQDAVIVEPNRQVTVGGGNMAGIMEFFPKLGEIMPGLKFLVHRENVSKSYSILIDLKANSYMTAVC